jgi:hypothetical protein
MTPQPSPILQSRIDEFSFQVSTLSDPRFWMRLEREDDRDVITDYFLGSFPRDRAGALLADCYRVLGLAPKMVLVFRDILPSAGPTLVDQELDEARDLYSAAGKALLGDYGATWVDERLENNAGKFDLVIVGHS